MKNQKDDNSKKEQSATGWKLLVLLVGLVVLGLVVWLVLILLQGRSLGHATSSLPPVFNSTDVDDSVGQSDPMLDSLADKHGAMVDNLVDHQAAENLLGTWELAAVIIDDETVFSDFSGGYKDFSLEIKEKGIIFISQGEIYSEVPVYFSQGTSELIIDPKEFVQRELTIDGQTEIQNSFFFNPLRVRFSEQYTVLGLHGSYMTERKNITIPFRLVFFKG